MQENMAKITTLQHLLDYDARKFTSAEIELKKSLQNWMNEVESIKLKQVLQRYDEIISQHIQKMESFLEQEKINSLSVGSRIMKAFIEEANEKNNTCSESAVKDACLLAAIQVINHFKISMYGTAAAFARALGMEKQAEIFHEAEVNEKQIDDRLSQLAEHEVNIKAKSPLVTQ